MKNILLVVIILLGVNCIAQTNRPAIQNHNSFFNSKLNYSAKTGNEIQDQSRPDFSRKGKMSLAHSRSKLESLTQLLDSVYMWLWDTTSKDWALDYKYSVTEYDANSNVLTELGMYWYATGWVNSDKTYYTYDEKNNALSYEWQFWTGTDWENDQKGSYEYDANNNILTELVQSGDGNNWVNAMLIKTTYDAKSNMTSYLHQNWNGEAWENYFQHLYTYDVNNNMTMDARQGWTGDQWEDSWQNTYVFDINNNLIHETNYVDNGAELVTSETIYFYDAGNKLVRDSTHTWGNSWKSDSQGTYTYDSNGNLISWLSQRINEELTENLTRTLFTYDAANNQTSIFRQDWKDNSWVSSGFDRHTYNEDNLLTNDAYKYWNSEGTMVLDGDSSTYYYHSLNTGIKEVGRSKDNIAVYPNPSGGIFSVEGTNTMNSFEIYNSLGQCIYSESGFNRQIKKEVDISKYGKGAYLLKIKTNSGIETKKLLIQ